MIQTTEVSITYKGDGVQTAFPYPYPYRNSDDIVGYIINDVGYEKRITNNFKYDKVSNIYQYPLAGDPLAAPYSIKLIRETPQQQNADLPGKLPFSLIEKSLDWIIMILQEIGSRCNSLWHIRNDCKLSETNARNSASAAAESEDMAKKWAMSPVSPDGVADTDSPTGYTQSAKIWAALAREYAGLNKFKLPIGYYNSVAEMKASETAIVGRPCVTLGYYQPNDGGGSVYLIRAKTDNDTDDSGSIIVLDNGSVAELLVDGEVNVKQFGARGDGTTDDLNPITKSIDLYSTIRIPDGKFYVSNSIFVNKSHKKILLSKNAYIFTGEKTTSTGGTLQILGEQIMAGNTPKSEDEITSYIEDIYISGGHIYNKDKTDADNVIGMGTVKDCIIENVIIDKGGRKGITVQYGGKNIKIKNCTICNCMCGISIEHFGSDILIDGNTITNISVGATNNYYLNNGIYAGFKAIIAHNYIENINKAGIYVMNNEEHQIVENDIKKCEVGILVSHGSAMIANNVITGTPTAGILTSEAVNVRAIGNNISGTTAPLRSNNKEQATNINIRNNYLSGSTYGVTLINTGVVNITNNYIETTDKVGIYLETNKTEEIIIGNEVKTKDITSSSIAIWSTDGSGKRIYIGNILYARTNIIGDGEVIAIGNNGDGAKDYTGASPLIKNNIMNGTVYALNTTATS